jgi:hypothetical protein
MLDKWKKGRKLRRTYMGMDTSGRDKTTTEAAEEKNVEDDESITVKDERRLFMSLHKSQSYMGKATKG